MDQYGIQSVIIDSGGASGLPGENQQFVPTLFIGLGGSGNDVVLRLRKRLYDQYKTVRDLPFVRFLVIDTDDSKTPKDEPHEDYQPVLLAPDEMVRCQLDDNEIRGAFARMRYQRDPRFVEWLKPELETQSAALREGAGAVRQFGRLAMFLKYADISGNIDTHLSKLKAGAAKPPVGFQQGQIDAAKLEVVILTSLAGGTGSGMFIDVCYLVQDILNSNHSHLAHQTTLISFLPNVFGKQEVDGQRHRKNAYAALLEMEYYRTARSKEPFLYSDESEAVGFRVNWEGTAGPKWVPGAGWHTAFLIDNVNTLIESSPLSTAEVFQMAADYLFLDFENSAFAAKKRSVRSNQVQILGRSKWTAVPRVDQHVDQAAIMIENGDMLYATHNGCTFSSFGLATIEIDENRVRQAAAYRLAQRVVMDYWLGDERLGQKIARGRPPEEWAREDLGDAPRPLDGQPPPSFKAQWLFERLYRDSNGGESWVHRVPAEMEQTLATPSDQAAAKLQPLLDKHALLLRSSTHANDAGQARQTLEHNYEELNGNPRELGILRKRLDQLIRDRVAQLGVKAASGLLESYRKAISQQEKVARQWEAPGNGGFLERLREASELPGFIRNAALRIELRQAGRDTQEEIVRRYREAAAKPVQKLLLRALSHVGLSNRSENSDTHKPLAEYCQEADDLLNKLGKQLETRFKATSRTATSDRKRTLLPQWEDREYDKRINIELMRQQGEDAADALIEGFRFNWTRLADDVFGKLKDVDRVEYDGVKNLADLLDKWQHDRIDTPQRINRVAEQLADACRRILGNIDLDDFEHGSVCDLLVQDRQYSSTRPYLLKNLVSHSASYFPSIRDTLVAEDFKPSYLNLVGLKASDRDAQRGGQNRTAIMEELETASQVNGTTTRDKLDEALETSPSMLIVCRQMAGIPLQYYKGIDDLYEAYKKTGLGHSVEECHIDYHNSFENLPEIRRIPPEGYAEIRGNVTVVLACVILGEVSVNDGVYNVRMPDPTGMGHVPRRLGKRINRVIMKACQEADVRNYLNRCWRDWKSAAEAADWAAFFVSVQKTYEELQPADARTGQLSRSSPARNCFALLFEEVRANMRSNPGAGAWLDALDSTRQPHHPARRQTIDYVTGECLDPIPLDERVSIWRIDKNRVAKLPLEPPDLVAT